MLLLLLLPLLLHHPPAVTDPLACTCQQVWCHGYWNNRWADAHYSLLAVNTDAATIQLGRIPQKLPDRTSEVCSGDCLPAAYTDSKKGGSYYCYNLLAELDTPGEYYLNRSAGSLYVWPVAGSTNQCECECILLLSYSGMNFIWRKPRRECVVWIVHALLFCCFLLSATSLSFMQCAGVLPAVDGRANVTASRLQHLIRVTGAKNVVFQGLHLRHARMAGAIFHDAVDSILSGGSVAMIGGMGVNISGGTNCSVDGLSVSDT
eukprot:COSAG05_NODE_6818_length_897_cov_13.698795_1_plen_261_part_10